LGLGGVVTVVVVVVGRCKWGTEGIFEARPEESVASRVEKVGR
jgi:hypothetical protein